MIYITRISLSFRELKLNFCVKRKDDGNGHKEMNFSSFSNLDEDLPDWC